MISIDFEHRQSAHCESGVTSNLLNHYGVLISEAMAFGTGAGLFFAYLPFIRIDNLPLTTYRCEVGGIFKRVTKSFGIRFHWQKFRNAQKAMDVLDEKLEAGIPVGCRTGGYWLPYMPSAFRFHFNMHNLVVIGKEGDDYIISDPVFPELERCSRKYLMKARFAKGVMAPKGAMYYLTKVSRNIDFEGAVKKGIKIVCRRMLKSPGPLIGVRGINYLAKKVKHWPEKLGREKTSLYTGQIIRMQEELGTGGAGFRFMYAAFLQEAADTLNESRFLDLSEKMTNAGDMWRKFAIIGARNLKGRASETDTYERMSDLLIQCAEKERYVYKALLTLL